MNLLRKLIRWMNDYGERISPRVEVVREPTIANDYPDKWAEIQWRRRALRFLQKMFVCGYSTLILWALYGLLITPVSDQQRAFVVLVVCPAAIIFFVAQECCSWFRCPRCKRNFNHHDPLQLKYDIHHASTRCQHCDLQLGEPSGEKPVR